MEVGVVALGGVKVDRRYTTAKQCNGHSQAGQGAGSSQHCELTHHSQPGLILKNKRETLDNLILMVDT